jgi:hypothetical protein
MSKHEREPFRAVLDTALDRLIVRLTEAQGYLDHSNDTAAIGALLDLDDLHGDAQAALRLFKSRTFL